MNIEKFLNISDAMLNEFIEYEKIEQCKTHNFLARLIFIHVVHYIHVNEYYEHLNNISYLKRVLAVNFSDVVYVYDINKIYHDIVVSNVTIERFAFLAKVVAIECVREFDNIVQLR